MQLTITPKTAKGLLKERNLTVAELRKHGRIEVSPNVYITLVGRCTYTLVDLTSASGDGMADMVLAGDRHLIPAWQEDAGGTRQERKDAGRLAMVKHRFMHR